MAFFTEQNMLRTVLFSSFLFVFFKFIYLHVEFFHYYKSGEEKCAYIRMLSTYYSNLIISLVHYIFPKDMIHPFTGA